MKEVYSSLLKQGWTMTAIDEMDIFYYFQVLAYQKEDQTPTGFIDDVM